MELEIQCMYDNEINITCVNNNCLKYKKYYSSMSCWRSHVKKLIWKRLLVRVLLEYKLHYQQTYNLAYNGEQ